MTPDAESAGRRRVLRLATIVTGPLASWAGVTFWLAVVAIAIPFALKLGSVETSRLTDRFMRRKRAAGRAIARASTRSTTDSRRHSASNIWLNVRTMSYFA